VERKESSGPRLWDHNAKMDGAKPRHASAPLSPSSHGTVTLAPLPLTSSSVTLAPVTMTQNPRSRFRNHTTIDIIVRIFRKKRKKKTAQLLARSLARPIEQNGHRHRVRLRSRRERARDLIASFGWTSSSCNRYVGFGPAVAPTRAHTGGWTAWVGPWQSTRQAKDRSNANARRRDGDIPFALLVLAVGVEIAVQN
jgi:hypothetical protein